MNKIIVFGLGAVGLPLALTYVLNDFSVIGIDINEKHIKNLKSNNVNFQEEDRGRTIKEILSWANESGKLKLNTFLPAELEGPKDIIVTVGIGVKGEKLDSSAILRCLEGISKNLKKGDLVLIRSTVYPGFTEEIALPILEKRSGLKGGDDFFLAYASERMQEGKAFEELRDMDVVLGGINQGSIERAKQCLLIISKGVFHVSSLKEVEASKVLENLQRDVNIAFANEVAYFLTSKGIKGREAIRLANTHKRVNILNPGPGVGGHCIPYAYYYLAHISSKERKLSLSSKARKLNSQIPEKIVSILKGYFSNLPYDQIKIALLGQAMKDFSSSFRLSPAYKLKKLLIKAGFNVYSYDPLVKTGVGKEAENLIECLNNAKAIVIAGIQQEYLTLKPSYLKHIVGDSVLVVDLKGLFIADELIKEGFTVFSL